MSYIFLADDDSDDREALKEALYEAGSTHQVMEALDGKDAFQKLTELNAKGIRPSLIILDINMPRMDGRQTLLSIQADQALSGIPVVMYTTASNALDQLYFNKKNVAFITKPSRYDALRQVASTLLSYCAS